MKIKKKKFRGGRCGGGRVGGRCGGVGGQGGCEWSSDAFVKIKKKNIFFFWGGGSGQGGGGSVGGVRVDGNGEVKLL